MEIEITYEKSKYESKEELDFELLKFEHKCYMNLSKILYISVAISLLLCLPFHIFYTMVMAHFYITTFIDANAIVECTVQREEDKNKDKNKNPIKSKLCCDTSGNIYLDINDNYYLMTIDKNDDLEFYEVNKNNLEVLENTNELKYQKIIDSDVPTLKRKVLESMEKENNSEHDSDDDEDEYQNYKHKMKYLHEDKYFLVENELGENDCENEKFDFYKKDGSDNIILMNKGISGFAIYDTYVRNECGDVFESIIFNNNNSYRVSFYKNLNTMELNIIGSIVKKYNLTYGYNKNELIIFSKKMNK